MWTILGIIAFIAFVYVAAGGPIPGYLKAGQWSSGKKKK